MPGVQCWSLRGHGLWVSEWVPVARLAMVSGVQVAEPMIASISATVTTLFMSPLGSDKVAGETG